MPDDSNHHDLSPSSEPGTALAHYLGHGYREMGRLTLGSGETFTDLDPEAIDEAIARIATQIEWHHEIPSNQEPFAAVPDPEDPDTLIVLGHPYLVTHEQHQAQRQLTEDLTHPTDPEPA